MKLLQWDKRVRASQTITKVVADELRKMKPGQAEIWTLEDGSQFTVMWKDDFDHVARLAGLHAIPAKDEA